MDGRNVQYSSNTSYGNGGPTADRTYASRQPDPGQYREKDYRQRASDNVKRSKDFKNELNQQLSRSTRTELLPGIMLEGSSCDLWTRPPSNLTYYNTHSTLSNFPIHINYLPPGYLRRSCSVLGLHQSVLLHESWPSDAWQIRISRSNSVKKSCGSRLYVLTRYLLGTGARFRFGLQRCNPLSFFLFCCTDNCLPFPASVSKPNFLSLFIE